MTNEEPKKVEETPKVEKPEDKASHAVTPPAEKPKEIVPEERIFVYDGREFSDPDPKMTPDEIRQYYVAFFPELANAEILAPVARPKTPADPGRSAIEFKRRVGTKGTTSKPPVFCICGKSTDTGLMCTNCKAIEMWKAMDKNEQAGVRFGMFPYQKMMDAKKAGFEERKLCVALMQCAKDNGGMRA
jgi:PRTRC genetic system protein C